MSEQTIKPCPSCGDSKSRLESVDGEGNAIDCYKCGMSGPVGVGFEHAVELWNALPRFRKIHEDLVHLVSVMQSEHDLMDKRKDDCIIIDERTFEGIKGGLKLAVGLTEKLAELYGAEVPT